MSRPPAGPHRCGHVAIVGRPSVGKSTLLNALVGEKISITSRKPQTTRHRITGILTDPDIQYVFVDTPGFQTLHRSRLNDRLNRAVRDSLAEVDVVVVVVDARHFNHADRAVLALCPGGVPVILALNKIDLVADKLTLLPRIAEIAKLRDLAAIVPISAERGTDLATLKRELARHLPESPSLYPEDEFTDRDERFLAAEFIREKIFRQLGDEVPYSTAVTIESFEHDGAMRRIRATVLVDRAGQRAILVGEGGARMKAIASAARGDMENAFGGRVFLEVWVKVKEGWSQSDATLTRLGY
ncbi:MAG TPA: GTPase Era [Casimicrobiaceae bacterium]|nr:GTPase Era [Casimicrobiaceae bacterium]